MKIIFLIGYALIATYFTYVAASTSYKETKRLCEISAFVWWLITLIEGLEMIIY